MTVETRDITLAPGDHVVQFYDEAPELARNVGAYMAQAIAGGGAAVAIATEPHLEAFHGAIQALGIDVNAAIAADRLVEFDAATALGKLMPAGRLDPEAFRRIIGGVLAKAGQAGGRVHAYGEMVALLWEAGDVPAAIELERLWNDIAAEHAFSLYCAYHGSAAGDPALAQALQEVCRLHTSVVHSRLERSENFPAHASSPRAARVFVAETLRDWGRYSAKLVQDAQLVISELATNALIHGGSPFSVRVRLEPAALQLWVKDSSLGEPTMRDRGRTAPSGRGLQVIDALSRRWGVEFGEDGKSVWAELAAA